MVREAAAGVFFDPVSTGLLAVADFAFGDFSLNPGGNLAGAFEALWGASVGVRFLGVAGLGGTTAAFAGTVAACFDLGAAATDFAEASGTGIAGGGNFVAARRGA